MQPKVGIQRKRDAKDNEDKGISTSSLLRHSGSSNRLLALNVDFPLNTLASYSPPLKPVRLSHIIFIKQLGVTLSYTLFCQPGESLENAILESLDFKFLLFRREVTYT